MDLKEHIRTIPDYPKPGILFRDVTTLIHNASAFEQAVSEMAVPWRGSGIDHVVGIEARGFIFGGPLALALGAGFIPLRKPGKLPFETVSAAYQLEYGEDALHMHADAITSGERVLIVDDLIATGGTAEAAVKLLRQSGAEIVGAAFMVDLPDLSGSAKLKAEKIRVETLMSFAGH